MTAQAMTDYSEHLVAARKALKDAEDAARVGKWIDMENAVGLARQEVMLMHSWAWNRRKQSEKEVAP